MKNIITISALLVSFAIGAQNDTVRNLGSIDLDLLKMPSNTAFNIMGTSPTEIMMPSSAPEFVIDVQNASNDFSEFPNNYGFSITPYWWIHGKTLSFEDDFSVENEMKPLRHLRVSGGLVSGMGVNENTWRYGLGLQTSLLVGKVDSSKKAQYYEKLLGLNRVLFEASEKVLKTVPRYQASEKKLNELIARFSDQGITVAEREKLMEELKEAQKEQKKLMEDLKRESAIHAGQMQAKDSIELYKSFNAMSVRYGWKWDVGVAAAYDLTNNKLDSSQMYRSGIWTNFGYSLKSTDKHQWSFLGAVRYFFYDEVVYATDVNNVLIDNLGVVDAGLRTVLEAKKLSLSLEAMYRLGLVDAFENTYKLNALINYRFSENRSVYFSFGNAFNDNSAAGPEQLSAFIGLNLGFGGKADVEYKLK